MFCSKCQSFWTNALSVAQISENITSCEDIRWPRYVQSLHRGFKELRASYESRCPICRAILHIPTRNETAILRNIEDDRLEILLEIDQPQGPYPVLFASFRAFREGSDDANVLIPKRMVASCAGLLNDDDLGSTLDRCAHLTNDSTGSDAAIELANFWLRRCRFTHDECKMMGSQGPVKFIPTRLLDVGNDALRLIETKVKIKNGNAINDYVALSHCWGKTRIIQTKSKSYRKHLDNIASSELSQTFTDAVHATRKLGFRYLWIDSLCIVQDDDEDWRTEAATMCNVYSNAAFTIAAAHAPGGDIGCFFDRDGTLQFPFTFEMAKTAGSSASSQKSAKLLFTSYGQNKVFGGEEPHLYSRAWVLQEQVLSPRMLIFDGPQIRWECLSMHGSERTPQGGISRHIGHQQLIRNGIITNKEFFDMPMSNHPRKRQIKHITWCSLVVDYTHRGMTKPKDRLIALDGIAKAIALKTESRYLAGLWSTFLWVDLLWFLPHWTEIQQNRAGAFDMENNPHIRHDNPIAPTWSWVSVTAPISYSGIGIATIHRVCQILSVDVSGSAASVEGSIKIRGHVRRGYVNSVYPYAIREAAHTIPSMACSKDAGLKSRVTFEGRTFSPNDFFIFRAQSNNALADAINPSWQLLRGAWRPDQIVDPRTEILFLAIAQENSGTKEGTQSRSSAEHHARLIHSIGLVPTGKVGEYIRVGYAVWEDCSWFGYLCGHKTRFAREIVKAKGWRSYFIGDDLERIGNSDKLDKLDNHDHVIKPDGIPDIGVYSSTVEVEEKDVVIL